jgi:small-conductance mechanosensitive channel
MRHIKSFILPFLLLIVASVLKYSIHKFNIASPQAAVVWDKVGSVLFIISCAAGLIVFIRSLKIIFQERFDISKEDNLKSRKFSTQFNILERIVFFLIILISIGLVLMLFEDVKRIGISLFASAGIAGIIVGFAAQRIIAAVIAGLQIAITQPIRIDDVLIIENEWGRVEEITLTYVVLKIWDQRRLIIPTTYFFDKPFQNWTRTSANILGTVFIYTDYNVPFQALREELTRLLESTPLWDKKVNVLQVTDSKEKTVEIRALMSAKDSPTAWELRVFVREKLIEFLQKNYPESLPKTRLIVQHENDEPNTNEAPKDGTSQF